MLKLRTLSPAENCLKAAGEFGRDFKRYLCTDLTTCEIDCFTKKILVDCSHNPLLREYIEDKHSFWGNKLFSFRHYASGVMRITFKYPECFREFLNNLRRYEYRKLKDRIDGIFENPGPINLRILGCMVDFYSTDSKLLDRIDRLVRWEMIGRIVVKTDTKRSVLFYDQQAADLFHYRHLATL